MVKVDFTGLWEGRLWTWPLNTEYPKLFATMIADCHINHKNLCLRKKIGNSQALLLQSFYVNKRSYALRLYANGVWAESGIFLLTQNF